MATAAFPSVIAGVVTFTAGVLPAARVVRGRDISMDPDDVVMIGVLADDEPGRDTAGSFRQSMQTFGGAREEVGEVNGLIVSRNGDADQDAACTTAFGYLAVLEAAVRANPTLGLTGFDYVVAELADGEVIESNNDEGAETTLPFTISYQIRI
jgi:hypothetical protein